MKFFKFLHAVYKCLDVFHGAGVVQGGAETAYAAVALDAHHAAFLGKGEEGIEDVLVAFRRHKAYVHKGTVLLGGSANKQAVAVNLTV